MPVIKQRPNTMYDNMEFEKGPWEEFPMAVPVKDGVLQEGPYDKQGKRHEVVIVQSRDELDALQGDEEVVLVPTNRDDPNSPMRVETDDDVRERLYVRAAQLGVQIDQRWGIARIEGALAKAEKSNDVV